MMPPMPEAWTDRDTPEDMVIRWALYLRNTGLRAAGILAALRVLWSAMTPGQQEGLSDADLEEIAEGAYEEVSPSQSPVPWIMRDHSIENWLPDDRDHTLAIRLIEDLGGRDNVISAGVGTYVWTGQIWQVRPRAEIIKLSHDYRDWPVRAKKPGELGQPASYPYAFNGGKNDINIAGYVANRTVPEESARGFWSLMELPPAGMATAAGFLRLAEDGTLTLEPHAREQYQTHLQDVDYTPGATPARFLSFLRDVFSEETEEAQGELIEFLREWIGAALLRLTGRFPVALVLHGEGSNGKSTLGRIIAGLFPDARGVVVSEQPADLDRAFSALNLAGAQLNFVEELSSKSWSDLNVIKRLVTCDAFTAEVKYGERFTFRPFCAHMLCTNRLPKIGEDSDGVWRRLAVVPFRRQFLDSDIVLDLDTTILKEERGDIIGWALDAVRALVERRRFELPAVCDVATARWRAQNDPVLGFVDYWFTCIATGSGPLRDARVKRAVLKGEFDRFYAEEGESRFASMSPNQLYQSLRDSFGMEDRKIEGARYIEFTEKARTAFVRKHRKHSPRLVEAGNG